MKRKEKALISCLVTTQLICTFDFAYPKIRFSHDAAHMYLSMSLLSLNLMKLIVFQEFQVVNKNQNLNEK